MRGEVADMDRRTQAEVFARLLDGLYTGRVRLCEDGVGDLAQAAAAMGAADVVAACLVMLAARLTPANARQVQVQPGPP